MPADPPRPLAVSPDPAPDLAIAAARFGAPPGHGGFAAGTLLQTPDGPVAVERLRAGDRLSTRAGGSTRLRHVGVRRPGSDSGVGMVLLPAAALGPGLPCRNLLLAAAQAVWLPDSDMPAAGHHALAAAGLVCGGAVRWAEAGPSPLYTLLAETAAVVLAEGLACALRPAIRPERSPHAGAALARARLAQLSATGSPPKPGPGASAAPIGAELAGAAVSDGAAMLRGWALDRAAPEIPVLLEILQDDLTIGFALADEARPDLAMAGLGACGFALALPPSNGSSPNRLLHVYAVGSGATLPGTPLLLARPKQG